MCSINSKKLCNDNNCLICFDKSFASSDKAQFFDKEKNGCEPRSLFLQSNKKYWFKCNICEHSFDMNLSNVYNNRWCPYCSMPCKKLCDNNNCQFCFNNSFASSDKAQFFDRDKNNNITPRQVFKQSGKKFWFKCNICEHNFNKAIYSITCDNTWCPYCNNNILCNNTCNVCFNKSFASHEKSQYYDIEKNNNITPRNIFLNDNKKYWFKCNVCYHYIFISLNGVNRGHWCSYCNKQKLCDNSNCQFCFNNSFASSDKVQFFDRDKNNGIEPRQVFKQSGKKYWFKCNICNHDFISSLLHIFSGTWCPYCCIPCKKLCNNNNCQFCFNNSFASHNRSQYFNIEKNNNITPRQVLKHSHAEYKFKCDYCNKYFSISLHSICNGSWCPLCKNKTEKKLIIWFENNNINIINQPKYDWCINSETNRKLPFDFVIEDKKLIIELDGMQHFKDVKYFKTTAKESILRDNYKTKCALDNNYSMIRIFQEDVYNDNNQWNIQLKKILDEHDNEDKLYIKFIGDKELYQFHITNL